MPEAVADPNRLPPTDNPDHEGQGPPTPDAPPDARALWLMRGLQPRIYTCTQGKAVIAFPPEYEPIPIHSRTFRGMISSKFEEAYNPEMIKDAAVRRVEAAFAGQAVQFKPPHVTVPLNPTEGQDPVLLSVFYYMIIHKNEKQGEAFKEYTRELMKLSRAIATKHKLSVDAVFDDVQLFGSRLHLLAPDFLLLGLEFEFKHKNQGSWVKVAWAKGFPKDMEDKDDGDKSSSKPSPDKPEQVKPLQRRDGRDLDELFSRLSAKQMNDKESQP